MEQSSRYRAILRRMWLAIFLLVIWGTAGAGHAPIIFYNVPNWYSSGWDQIRYATPYDAFAGEWEAHNPPCSPSAGMEKLFASAQVYHLDGSEDGDLYSARVNQVNCDDGSSTETGYPPLARRWAMCPGSDWGPYNADAWHGECPPMSPNPGKNQGAPSCPTCAMGDPVNPATGNKFETLELGRSGGSFPVSLVITYNSTSDASVLPPNKQSFGKQRVHNYQMRIAVSSSETTTSAYVLRPDGKTYVFDRVGSAWTGDTDVPETLESSLDSFGSILSWTYTRVDGTKEQYDATGALTKVVRKDGQSQALAYDSLGNLKSVADSQGRAITFDWNEKNRVVGIHESDGSLDEFTYDASDNLTDVTFADNSSRRYVYGEYDAVTNFAQPSDMTGQIDESGVRVDTTTYLKNDHTVRSNSGAGGSNAVQFSGLPGTQGFDTYAATDALGGKVTASLVYISDVPKPTTITRSCDGCTTQTTTYTYDTNGRIATKLDGNGNLTSTTFDANGLLLTKVDAKGSASQRTTETTWDTSLRLPLVRTVKDNTGNIVSKEGWAYNTAGQTTAQCLIDPVAAPSYTCSPSGTATSGVRRTVMTYCTAVNTTTCPLIGLLLKTDGPRTDVTDTVTNAYYLTTDESGCATAGGVCHRLGDLKSTTDGAGLVTTYVSYDKAGRVTRMKDPNGVLTDYAYTARGWLSKKTVRANTSGAASSSDATTTIAYDPTGTVHSVKDADGVTTTYTYDAAHRLTDITDAGNRRYHYTLDATGNRTKEEVITEAGTVVRTTSRAFNTLGQLTAITDGLNRTVFNAGFADSYDANGNLVHSQDGLSVQQKQVYDGLDRLVSTLQDYQGSSTATANSQTVTSFDALDRVAGFSDPDSLNTTYDLDAYGNVAGIHSPDTGTTSRSFDISGNTTSSTDATSATNTSTFDAKNRIWTTTYADASLNVQYKYDEADSVTGCSGSFGKGHLTRLVEGSGGIIWCYDNRGNVVTKRQTAGNSTRTTSYAWTLANRLSAVTTPNGTVIGYIRNSLDQVVTVTATPPGGPATTVVSGVVYKSFGPVASYKLGNGQTVALTYDAAGALTDIASTAFTLHVKRDAMGNIKAIGNNAGVATPTETYTYDPLYRLTGVKAASGMAVEAYTYNKAGDRLSKAAPGMLTGMYTYASDTHQLTGVGTATRQIDARGNLTASILASGAYTFGYSGRNRLTSVQNNGATVGTYVINALGERIQKSAGGIATRFDYDEDSRLLSEATDATARDYVWMDSLPVAIVDRVGSTSSVAFVHADGLGSPRAVTDAAGTVLWQWAYASNPFGEKAPTSSGYTLNMRFPGQYFDAESGLAYNLNRDYEAASGRYVQSDPGGLDAGPNTFAYSGSSPQNAFDELGLQAAPAPGVTPGFLPLPPPSGAIPDLGPGANDPALPGPLGALCMRLGPAGVVLFSMMPNSTSGCDQPSPPDDSQCPGGDACEAAKRNARDIYWKLVSKRIPQFQTGGVRGRDSNHLDSVLQLQQALRKAISRVRYHCPNLPPEIGEWERVGNLNAPGF